MVFSSPVFLFLFLPIALLGYYLSTKYLRNYWLLLASFVFFAWGGVSFTLILIISILINYLFGLLVGKYRNNRRGYVWLSLGVSCNILILGIYKYANFFSHLAHSISEYFKLPEIQETSIALPIGISFYTFHSLSYLVDIYRGKTEPQKNVFNLALYVSMFSQLVAGPIIRYSDVWKQLTDRKHSLELFSSGVERFLTGLAKKVLLANTFGRIADILFNVSHENLGAANAWLGLTCYTLQIYCDFSGYSDMAIGLGRMFGFQFLENFNFPYLAKSVTEFWRRWHISLSSFFRDYVYIPLGGNRLGKSRQYVNLILVFFLTGFWHGANWTFIVWGLFHGSFLLLEKVFLGKLLNKIWKPLANIYTLLVVMFAWVLFRNPHLGTSVQYWRALFDFHLTADQQELFLSFMNPEFFLAFILAVLGSFGVFKWVYLKLNTLINSDSSRAARFSLAFDTVSALHYAGIVLLCTLYLISGTYNPFIYYRF